MELLKETRYALRGLARRPALAITAVLTLALGIGANLAVFSVVNRVLLQPLDYAAPDRLVTLWPNRFFANREIEYMRSSLRTAAQVASLSPGWLSALTGVSEPTEVDGARVSGNLFSVLGVKPALGRTFGMEAEVPGQDMVAVLSWELWRTQFAGDPTLIGRTIDLDRQPYQVVGVMPPGFRALDQQADLWLPMAMDPQTMSYAGAVTFGVARLRPGATVAQLDAELRTVVLSMGVQFGMPDDYGRAAYASSLEDSVVGPVRGVLLVLLGAVLFILLIAAANVANLLLVRATERRTELAVRLSLGASRVALLRQLAVESLVVALLGGGAGVLIGLPGVALLKRILPADTPRLPEIALDWRALLFAGVLTLLVALLIGVGPMLFAAPNRMMRHLSAGRTVTAGANRARGALIVVEVALAVVLVTGALLMIRTMDQLRQVDPGFRSDHLLTMRVQPSHLDNNEQLVAYWRDLLPRLAALPGVQSAGTVLHVPMTGRKWNANVEIEGVTLPAGATPPRTAWQVIDGDYLRAMGIPLLRGRVFNRSDDAAAPLVALVNTELAARHWPGRDPIGARIRAGNATRNQWVTVIGVVGAVRHDSLTGLPGAELYVPFAQRQVSSINVVLRTSADPRGLANAARETIWSVSREVPVAQVRTMEAVLARTTTRQRVVSSLLGAFAAIGLLLGAIGIYGLVSYTVQQRRRELGIRMALGATPRAVARFVTRSGTSWAAAGVVAGMGLALLLTRFMQGLVFGIAPRDPATFIAVPVVLLATAWVAAYLPARRAGARSPAAVLRE